MPSGANNTEQDKVRELQVKLYLAAKRSPGRRFHATLGSHPSQGCAGAGVAEGARKPRRGRG